MFIIYKNESCAMCGGKLHVSGSGRKKEKATQNAQYNLNKIIYAHRMNKNNRCYLEHKLYEKNLKEYLRPNILKRVLAHIINNINEKD